MINNVKALVVILAIAIAMYAIAKPVCLRFMEEIDFRRRRNIWFVLTIAAFLSPNFWLFAAISAPLLAWGAKRDPNPLALYVLVFCAIPPTISFEIPIIGVNALFRINYMRLLALAILIPMAWRILKSEKDHQARKLNAVDFCVLGFAVWHLSLLLPYESITHNMRRSFLHFLDIVILYFVATRACTRRRDILEVMAMFCLLCSIIAPLAVFESQRHWLLYSGISDVWGDVQPIQYATRDGSLRASVSAGQSIPLGFLLAFGFALWLYLSSHIKSRVLTIAFGTLMWVGMIAAHARAPWIAAVLAFFVYMILGPNGPARFFKALIASSLLGGLLIISPIGDRVVDNLPFIGKVGAENVEYRQELAKQSWEQIKQNPLFGNPLVLKNLESLRQGEGIIDLLNAYTTVAMYYGLPALIFFIGPFLICTWNAYRTSRRSTQSDPDLASIGAIFVACSLGFLFGMGAGGFGPCPQNFSIVIIGLSVTYSRLQNSRAKSTQSGFNPVGSHAHAERR